MLLSDGDEIRISPRITLVFRSHIPNDVYETDDVQETETNVCHTFHSSRQTKYIQYFLREYRITSRKLGSGAHGCVNMAVKESTGGQLACKIVDLRKVRAEERRKFHKLNEIRSKDNDGPKTPQALAKVLSDTQSLKVEEHTNKLAREVELLKELSHVSGSTRFITTLTPKPAKYYPLRKGLSKLRYTVYFRRTYYRWRSFLIPTV